MALSQLALAAIVFTVGSAHSQLGSPTPEGNFYCNAGKGCKPCEKVPARLDRGFSEARVAATWERGQNVRYSYYRNNHEQGFVRLSIIPMKYRGDHAAHEKFAFKYHCFAGPKRPCPSKAVCGSDQTGRQYYHDFTVPNSIPDGVYHFSFGWFGGGKPGRRIGYVPFYSCSVIKIAGGQPLRGSWPVSFESSKASSAAAPGKCETYARSYTGCNQSIARPTKVGRATRYWCFNKPQFESTPSQFTSEGPSPSLSITSDMFGTSTAAPRSASQNPEEASTTTGGNQSGQGNRGAEGRDGTGTSSERTCISNCPARRGGRSCRRACRRRNRRRNSL